MHFRQLASRQTSQSRSYLRKPAALLFAAVALFIGCTPQWLPDSSGFIFVTPKGQVLLYDINAKTSRQVTDTKTEGGEYAIAAIFPKGDRVAVVKSDLQVLVFDLEGNQLHASPLHKVRQGPAGDPRFPMMHAYVSPDGRRVLMFGSHVTSVYSPEDRAFREIDELLQPPGMAGNQTTFAFADVSPITPDGKGFIAVKTERTTGKRDLVFCAWDGKKITSFTFDNEASKVPPMHEFVESATFAPAFHWDNGVLVGRCADGLVRINPTDRRVSYVPDPRTQQLKAHARKHKVDIVCELADGAVLQLTAKQELELWRPVKKEADQAQRNPPAQNDSAADGDRTKVAAINEKNNSFFVSRSPNSRYAFVRPIAIDLDMRLVDAKVGTVVSIDPSGTSKP